MPTRPDLTRLLTPQSIAIIGASTNLTSISGQPLRLMLDAGYAGKLYPVNPRREEVQGLKAYPSAVDIPGPCDVALLAVSAARSTTNRWSRGRWPWCRRAAASACR